MSQFIESEVIPMDDDADEVPELVELQADTNKVIPITILSGFLGSGKTTLLNKILTGSHGLRIAVIENEFSEGLGIEGMIAKSGINGDNISNFFELNNGCICCTVKDSLLQTLEQLVIHQDRFDYIVIETTGMANPGPIISSFWTDDNLGSCLKIDGVICVVDSANICQYLSSPDISYEVRQQLSYADRILMNKVDLVSSEQLAISEKAVREINRFAHFGKAEYGNINLDFVLAINSYSSSNGLETFLEGELAPVFCYTCEPGAVPTSNAATRGTSATTGHPKSTISSAAFRFSTPFNLRKLQAKLDYLVYEQNAQSSQATSEEKASRAMKIYRIKGLIHVDQSPVLHILQAVHNLFDIQESEYIRGNADDRTDGQSLVIVIGANLNPVYLEQELRSAAATS